MFFYSTFDFMNVDYIIVGLGLAGLSFSEELLKQNKSFVVFEDDSQNSSLVAGGVYNPVILKRFTPVWDAYEQLKIANPFYKELEEKLNIQFDTKVDTKKVFNSIGDQNNWFMASDKPILSNYMKPKIYKSKINGVIANFGYGELIGTGWLDTQKLLATYRKFLKQKETIRREKFDYSLLEISEIDVKYKDIKANKIVFCEGFGVKNNPFFKELPLDGTKGETITIYAPELKIDFLLKSKVFVLPIEKDTYKVGATFNWTDKTDTPTEEGRQELEKKLQKTISVPYKIIEQSAGIRPTVKDRRPLVGVHSKYKNLAILNGFGTRGVMIAPTVAKNLLNYLEKGEKLDKKIDIKRFSRS